MKSSQDVFQPSQEEREKEILNTNHNKLSIDGVQIYHHHDIKENWITGSEYLPSIILNNIKEYSELNSEKKASKEGRNSLFPGHIMSVTFNPITSSLKYCLVKVFAILQTRVNENPYSVWLCIHDDGSIFIGECDTRVFAILYYIENRITLGHNKTAQANNKNVTYVRTCS